MLSAMLSKARPGSKGCGARPERPRGPRPCAITKARKGAHLTPGAGPRSGRLAPLEAPLTNRLGFERLPRKERRGGRRRQTGRRGGFAPQKTSYKYSRSRAEVGGRNIRMGSVLKEFM
ncbi:hypothetical protein MLD38_023423 [Melastoma candidum]|uniref:Uncharacterized protein n=1 Tax=Melastoma candidum TaxID=119954 RepID=A0ACB9QQY1_9MYRT|nr:hypothetical protein MLD38_023423 [Melastoma candidum]